MKQLGVATNLFTNHIYYWGDLHYSTFAGPDRARDMDPAGSAQRLGIPFSLHSDASVTPVDPLFCDVDGDGAQDHVGAGPRRGGTHHRSAGAARRDARRGLPARPG